MNNKQSSSGRLLWAKNLIEKLIFIQAGLPLTMPLDRVQPSLARQGQKAGRFHRSQGGHQRIQSAANHLIFWKVNLFFHFRLSVLAFLMQLGGQYITLDWARQR